MSFDWKETLKTVAPVIASALGTPVAGVAVSVALDALGIDGGEDDLIAAITSGKPEVMAALKKAEQDFKVEMRRLDIDLERINAQDRDSARGLAKTKGIAVQAILSAVFVIAFGWIITTVFSGENAIHESMRDTAIYMLGILSGAIAQILNFWFGSSEGSKQKTAQMAIK
jgi:hypothetical protein